MSASATPPAPAAPAPAGPWAYLRATGLSTTAISARLVLAVCAGLLPLFLLLPYSKSRVGGASDTASGWEYMQSSDILVLLGALAIVALVVLSFTQPWRALWLRIAVPLAFVLVGLCWPGGAFGDFGTGGVLKISVQAGGVFTTLFALVAAFAGLLALREQLPPPPAGGPRPSA